MGPFGKSLMSALYRSVDLAKNSAATALRMEVEPSAASLAALPIWSIARQADIIEFATGSDSDLGGLSTSRLDWTPGNTAGRVDETRERAGLTPEGHGRFWGTLSNQVPRGCRVDRTGYAGMRNRNRPTLFGAQTWDVDLHPYLAFRVRNPLALPSSAPIATPSLSSVLGNHSTQGLHPFQKAKTALGSGLNEPLGPKYFINIQTDGPVTSDLFQHRLWLDPSCKDDWQTIVVPLGNFLLLNSGEISASNVGMMRSALRTVGISCVLEAPRVPETQGEEAARKEAEAVDAGQATGPPVALRAKKGASTEEADAATRQEEADRARVRAAEEDDWGSHGDLKAAAGDGPSLGAARGSKRGQSYRFDLGIQGVHAVGSVEQAQELWSK